MYRILLILAILIYSTVSYSTEWHLVDVHDLSTEYYQYQGVYRNSYLINSDGSFHQLNQGGALNMNIDILQYMYANNRLHIGGDDTQVRYVGWEWESGLRVHRTELFWHHHSQHVLEDTNIRGDKFPLENYVGIRMHIIGNE